MVYLVDFILFTCQRSDFELKIFITAEGGRSTRFLVLQPAFARAAQIARDVKAALPKVVDAHVDGAVLILRTFDGAAILGAEVAVREQVPRRHRARDTRSPGTALAASVWA